MVEIENPQYDRATCYFCLTEQIDVLEEHHIVPRRFGGGDEAENKVVVCSNCHWKLEKLYDKRFYDKLGVEKLEELDDDGGLDADYIHTGTRKEQRDRIMNVLDLVESKEDEHQNGAPVENVVKEAKERGLSQDEVEKEISKLKGKGEVYEPAADFLRTT